MTVSPRWRGLGDGGHKKDDEEQGWMRAPPEVQQNPNPVREREEPPVRPRVNQLGPPKDRLCTLWGQLRGGGSWVVRPHWPEAWRPLGLMTPSPQQTFEPRCFFAPVSCGGQGELLPASTGKSVATWRGWGRGWDLTPWGQLLPSPSLPARNQQDKGTFGFLLLGKDLHSSGTIAVLEPLGSLPATGPQLHHQTEPSNTTRCLGSQSGGQS